MNGIDLAGLLGLLVAASVLAPDALLVGRGDASHVVLFFDDFEDGNYDGWVVTDDPEPQLGPSIWVVENGELVQKSNIWSYASVEMETKYHLGTHVTTGDDGWTDYSLNAILRSTDDDGIGLIVRYQDERNYYRVLLMNDPRWSGRDSSGVPVNTPLQRLQKFVDGEPYILAENKVAQAYPSGYFSLTLDVRGDFVRAWLNGELILSARDATFHAGRIGLMSYANAGSYYDDVLVTRDAHVYDRPERRVHYPVREFRAPYIQRPTKTSVEIAWRTLASEIGRVAFGIEKGNLDREVVEPGPRQKHHVHLADLLPSTRYYYTVYSGEKVILDEENFRTARRDDETRFSFLVLGDSGVDTPAQWAVARQMRQDMNRSEVDFIVHVGDVHQGRGDYYDDIYFKPYRDVIQNVNVFTALGNHDVITDDGGVYLDDFYLPYNNPDSTERYYSFRWANAYFICLDTNGDYRPGSPQHDFLLTRLADSLRLTATWTFVYAHHPPYSEHWTGYYGELGVQQHLVPVFEQYEVDMVMNGHTHSYERGEKNHVHYLVSGGGGGALDDYFVDYEHITFSDAVHHFTRIDVDGDQFTVTSIDEGGRIVDRFTVNKRSTVASEPFAGRPPGLELDQNYPNPVTDWTTITYRVGTTAQVRIVLYDLQGRVVSTLVDRRQRPGAYRVAFDASGLPAGLYLYRITSGLTTASRHLTIVR